MQRYTVMRTPVIINREDFFGNDGLHEIFTQHMFFTPTRIVNDVPPEVGNKIIDKERLRSKMSLSNASCRSSTHSYINFKKKANESLVEINNNLSCLLQETFKGIDDICNKVRNCLSESNYSVNNTQENTSVLSVLEERNAAISAIEEVSERTEDKTIIEENDSDEPSIIIEETKIEETKIEEATKEPVKFFTEITPVVGSNKADVKIKTNLDQIKTALKEIEEAGDFDKMMSEMVHKVHSKIEESYSSLQQIYKTGEGMCKNLDEQESKKQPKKKEEPRTPQNKSRIKTELETCISNDLITDSMQSLSVISNVKKGILPKVDFSPADVYRKRAFTDLNEKLKSQLEANDSLLFFQRLMERARRRVTNMRSYTPLINSRGKLEKPKCQELDNFSVAFSKFNKITNLTKKYDNSLWFNVKTKSNKNKKGKPEPKKKKCKKSVSAKALTGTSKIEVKPLTAIQNKRRKSETFQNAACTCKMVVTNDEPISDADKCKMHWMRAKHSQMSKKLKYLDILDDITAKDVLPIKSEYPRKDDKYIAPKNIRDTYLYKLIYGKKKETTRAWSQLFEPSIKCSTKNCVECQECKEQIGDEITKKETPNNQGDKVTTNMSKKEVIKKLSKYLYDLDERPKSSTYTVTVMPVHVFYDNKLPLHPMKETANIKRAEWQTPNQSRPMKAPYEVGLPKRDLKPSASARNEKHSVKPFKSGSYSPKNFTQFCKVETMDKLPSPQYHPPRAFSQLKMSPHITFIKPPSIKSAPTPNKGILKHEVPNKPNRQATVKVAKLSQCDYLNLESSIRPKMSEEQRRLQAHKYGKAVSQKLVEFVENQKQAYEIPVPSYAKPKNLDQKLRQRQMLDHLHNLKQRNDSIQTNIQKAIEVIECKMTDILSQPNSSNNIVAFNEMEKEITDVLNLMKTQNKRPNKALPNFQKEKKKNIEDEDVDKISDELFNKLTRILESTTNCSSTNSSRNSVRVEKVHKRKKPSKILSTTTTISSEEEKFVVTSFSPKKNEEITLDRPAGDQMDETKEEEPSEMLVLSDRSQGDCASEVKKELVKEIEEMLDDLETKEQEVKQEVQVAEKCISCNETISNLSEKIVTDSSTEPIKELQTETSSYKETISKDTETTLDDLVDKNLLSSPSEHFETPHESPKELVITPVETGVTETVTESSGDPLDSKNFCENVDKIIMRVETIYNTLNEFEEENTPRDVYNKKTVPVFREQKNEDTKIDSETFLTPFMKEIKERKMGDSRPESPMKSASYYNVLSFLDTLTDATEEKAIEVCTARLVYFARAVYYPVTYHLTCITNFLQVSSPSRQGCLKKCEEPKKPDKKVSFLLKEDKNTQAHICPHHDTTTTERFSKDECQNTESYVTAESQTVEESKPIVQEMPDSSDKTSDNISTLQNQECGDVPTVPTNQDGAEKTTERDEEKCQTDFCQMYQEVSCVVSNSGSEGSSSDSEDKKKNKRETRDDLRKAPNKNDLEIKDSDSSFYDSDEVKVFREETPTDSLAKIIDNKLSEVYYGVFGKDSLERVKSSQNLEKKQNSLEKLIETSNIIQETTILQPLKNVNDFMDVELLKKVVKERQELRLLRRKSSALLVKNKVKKEEVSVVNKVERDNVALLKGFYAIVYIIVFTALNLEYKCV